jgi:hypothetical protein
MLEKRGTENKDYEFRRCFPGYEKRFAPGE